MYRKSSLQKLCVGRGWQYRVEQEERAARVWRCSSLPTNDRPEQMVSLLKFYYTTIPLVMSDCDSIVTIHDSPNTGSILNICCIESYILLEYPVVELWLERKRAKHVSAGDV